MSGAGSKAPSRVSAAGEEDALALVLGACRERLERGEIVDPDEVAASHPQFADLLRPRIEALLRLDDWLATRSGRREAAEDVPPGATVGPYRLIATLGAGGMGTVHLAEHDVDGGSARVAVKVIHPHLLSRRNFRQRFAREAALGREVVHENVVRTLDAGSIRDDGREVLYLVLEYVEGKTLAALLQEISPLPEELCRHIGRAISKGLGAIHAAGAVHRDVKPENVLITDANAVKLMDFGVARPVVAEPALSETGAFVGSVLYAAPEQLASRTSGVDARTDLHAVGVVLYELATGRHPFAADSLGGVVQRVLHDRARPAGEANPALSPFFEEVLRVLLAKAPEDRFASAAELFDVLERGEDSEWWKSRAASIRRSTGRALRRIQIPRETAVHGRDAELAQLRGLFDAAKAGDGRVLLLQGEAGVGKSRLVDEFVARLAQDGEDVQVLCGSYPPGGAATASGAFAAAYREHFGDESLEDSLRRRLTATPLLVPALSALLRGDAAPAGAEPLTKDSLQTCFVHVTRALAAERPTIVLIDDLHFATQDGLALFASLALAVPSHRIVLIGGMRPGLDEKWVAQLARREQTTHLVLPRLGPKELVGLLADALGSRRLAEELGGLIAVKSDGNPFFVFELLRGLRDGRFLAQRPDGTWETTQIVRDIRVPSSIQELVQGRVADLGEEDRSLLDVAACCGYEFDPLLVGDVLGLAQIPVMRRLARIEKRHRLVHSAGRRFVFDHHQVQEALYEGMPELLREPYHAAIAEALERRHDAAVLDPQDLGGALCVDLADHFLRGASGARALRYLDSALMHLDRNYLNDAAVRLANDALAVPALLAGSNRCVLLLRVAYWLDLAGRRDAQAAALDEALSLADAAGTPALRSKTRNALGEYLGKVSRFGDAQRVLGEALVIAGDTGDQRAEANASCTLGNLLRNLGHYHEARRYQERHLELAQAIGDPTSEATAADNLAVLLARTGCPDQARRHHERRVALARESGDLHRLVNSTGNLGRALHELGRHDEARSLYEDARVLAHQIGDRMGEASANVNLGTALFALGRLEEARQRYDAHRELAREIGDQHGEAMAAGNLGCVFRELGRFDDACRLLESRLAAAREHADLRGEARACRNLGELMLCLDRVEEACDHLERSLSLARSSGNRAAEADALVELGAVEVARRHPRAAIQHLETAIALAKSADLRDLLISAVAARALLPGGDSRELADLVAAQGRRGMVMTEMRAYFVLWQTTGDRAHLAEAHRRLVHLVEHAPEDCRASMLTTVRLNRDIMAAAKAAGL